MTFSREHGGAEVRATLSLKKATRLGRRERFLALSIAESNKYWLVARFVYIMSGRRAGYMIR